MTVPSSFGWALAGVFAFVLAAAYAIVLGPPADFPIGSVVRIPPGESVSGAALLLAEKGAVRFPLVFSTAVRLGRGSIAAGTYSLATREDALSLAYRFSRGETGLAAIKVTIPEGDTAREAASILERAVPDFDAGGFLALAKPDEGYLFPDTYFFSPDVSPRNVVDAMRSDYERRVAPLRADMAAFGKPESDVVVMASLLEKEARQEETRRVIAGILWKRLDLGMPLQVDATFGYIFGTTTYSPSAANLAVDSPYNTYKYKGLPPGPIGNPGVETIRDAITPIQTPYLYYVTDKDGNIYYARTYEEQLRNIQKAL